MNQNFYPVTLNYRNVFLYMLLHYRKCFQHLPQRYNGKSCIVKREPFWNWNGTATINNKCFDVTFNVGNVFLNIFLDGIRCCQLLHNWKCFWGSSHDHNFTGATWLLPLLAFLHSVLHQPHYWMTKVTLTFAFLIDWHVVSLTYYDFIFAIPSHLILICNSVTLLWSEGLTKICTSQMSSLIRGATSSLYWNFISSSPELRRLHVYYMTTSSSAFHCFMPVAESMKGSWSPQSSDVVSMKSRCSQHEVRMQSPWRILGVQNSRLHWTYLTSCHRITACVTCSTSTTLRTYHLPVIE